jgi:hypothetical protein
LIVLSLVFFFFPRHTRAQNPVTPIGLYTADPSAHVWKDGRLYLYVSRDESPKYYCSWDYPVLSSDDLIHWRVDRNIFASRGEGDQVPYSEAYLYAPDCQERNGIYYLYYCLSGGGQDEGVAVGKTPIGPFTQAQAVPGISQIDPCCFIDDDGQSYLIWGQFACKIAKLNPDMRTVDPATLREIATEKDHFFHEGASMVKRGGLYYLVYADISRRNTPTCLGYAVGKSPLGPFVYRGVIIDNTGSDPLVWNNHGSLVEFKDRWYVFYHRSTHGSKMMRKTCVEPISFNPDGSIPEVAMSSQGAAPALDAFSRVESERACQLTGYVRIQFDEAIGSEELGKIENGNMAAYKYLDFGEGAVAWAVRAAGETAGGKITIRIDQPWGPAIAIIDVPPGGDGKTWRTLTGSVKPIRGIHPIWLHFSGPDGLLMKIDWFEFRKRP